MRSGAIAAALACLALGLTAQVRAHDLKVLVSRPVVEPGTQDTVSISFGHVLPVDTPVDAETIDAHSLRSPSGSVSYQRKEGVPSHENVVHVHESGTYQAVATRKPSVFCEVVDDHGNHAHVRGPKSSISEGRVESSTQSHQFAKALIVSGPEDGPDLEPLGHAIELVPLEGPSAWKAGRDLKFRVLFRGEPLRSADVLATYIGFKPDSAWCYATATDRDGVATIRPSQPGTWVAKAKVQKPAPPDRQSEYDLESHTATLAFEVRP